MAHKTRSTRTTNKISPTVASTAPWLHIAGLRRERGVQSTFLAVMVLIFYVIGIARARRPSAIFNLNTTQTKELFGVIHLVVTFIMAWAMVMFTAKSTGKFPHERIGTSIQFLGVGVLLWYIMAIVIGFPTGVFNFDWFSF